MGDIIGILILVLFIGLFVAVVLKLLFDVLRVTLGYMNPPTAKRLNIRQVQKLRKYSPYFRDLKLEHQKEFIRRVGVFIGTKEFISRKMRNVTSEMKIVVASLAVQVTFGLPYVYLEHFGRILIYPDNYYSTINNQYHKGEVNPRFGIIVLSWNNLVKGISNETDGINLGIHELAHALHLENRIANEEFDFLDKQIWSMYSRLAYAEMAKIKAGKPSLFRSIAGSDHYEFFAVLLENFFERPKELKAYHASLYDVTCRLLMQDPLTLTKN